MITKLSQTFINEKGKGGRPALIVNSEKYHVQNIKNSLVQLPWGVEVTWAILTTKNVTRESTIYIHKAAFLLSVCVCVCKIFCWL